MKNITFLVASALLISGVAGRTFTVCIALLVLRLELLNNIQRL